MWNAQCSKLSRGNAVFSKPTANPTPRNTILGRGCSEVVLHWQIRILVYWFLHCSSPQFSGLPLLLSRSKSRQPIWGWDGMEPKTSDNILCHTLAVMEKLRCWLGWAKWENGSAHFKVSIFCISMQLLKVKETVASTFAALIPQPSLLCDVPWGTASRARWEQEEQQWLLRGDFQQTGTVKTKLCFFFPQLPKRLTAVIAHYKHTH